MLNILIKYLVIIRLTYLSYMPTGGYPPGYDLVCKPYELVRYIYHQNSATHKATERYPGGPILHLFLNMLWKYPWNAVFIILDLKNLSDMGVSWVIGVPPVIIHLFMLFSLTKTNHFWVRHDYGNPHMYRIPPMVSWVIGVYP